MKRSARHLISLTFVFALCLPGRPPASAQGLDELSRTYSPRLEKILTENIAPFWYDKAIDKRGGGYTINFGPRGEAKGPGTKMIVTQARTVWLFARLARAGYKRAEYLRAAEHGYRFLREKMWDRKNGGFYWEVDATGDQLLKPKKHLYGQSFALYAVSEYYLASRRKDVLDFAVEFFNLLEAKSHDEAYGGYVEFFNEDWTPPAPGTAVYMGGGEVGFKLMNTHLHLLEAMTTFYRASKLPLAKDRLVELIGIESSAVVRKRLGACTDKYERDWTPRLEGDYARVSYGHDLENIWLLVDACRAAGIPDHPYLDLYRTLFDYSLKYGYDAEQGGFYYLGQFERPAENLQKSWWVQAEAVVSALYMYRLTKDAKYLDAFTKTFEFIEKYQVDWEHGEWHAIVLPDGSVQGDKAQPWKAGYHNGRAMIECLELLNPARAQRASSR
jgi:mannose/cellobiose epimerase-like protein (N-acyl-D-glucosamine 2-epimerase family)